LKEGKTPPVSLQLLYFSTMESIIQLPFREGYQENVEYLENSGHGRVGVLYIFYQPSPIRKQWIS